MYYFVVESRQSFFLFHHRIEMHKEDVFVQISFDEVKFRDQISDCQLIISLKTRFTFIYKMKLKKENEFLNHCVQNFLEVI